MAEHNDKKTLTVSGKLSVKLGDKLTLGAASSVKAAETSTSGRGRVVVVTKQGRGIPGRGPGARSTDAGGLTAQERDKRMLALKSAEIEKQRIMERAQKGESAVYTENAAEHQLSGAEQVVEDAKVNDAGGATAGELDSASDIGATAPTTLAPTPQLRRMSVDELARKGKVKNLDGLYRMPLHKTELREPQAPTLTPTKPLRPAAKDAQEGVHRKGAYAEADEEVVNVPAPSRRDKDSERRVPKKVSVEQVMMMDEDEGANFGRRRSLASIRRARDKARRKMMLDNRSLEKIVRDVAIPDFIVVQDLASRMSEKAADVVKALMKLGVMVTVTQSIDADTAELIVGEFGHKARRVTEEEIEAALLQKVEDRAEDELPRAPVITIMGHVDHGKTSLLDALRNTDVAAGEAGGITQHIGAYQVTLENKKVITFLDTPGHEAFTAMRMRGARVTDIVVLVVAADDGIMPQTIEAINHAKAAQVPIIVAVNKIDKPAANPMRVINDLLQHGIIAESLGGDAIIVEVSAKQRINLDKLEEMILLQAEVLELKANPNRLAEGAIVEAKIDKGRGPVATLLVQRGTICIGDIVVAGATFGKIRALINDKGKQVESAGPSTPIEILGLEYAPTAGDEFVVVPNEKVARDIVSLRNEREKQRRQSAMKPASLELMFKRAREHGTRELAVIIKADVQGSVEAIANSLQKLGTEEISVRILHQAVGGITESDVTLATASRAIIIGFNVRAGIQARDMAKTNGVDIRYYAIIYNLVDDVKAAMSGMLSPTIHEDVIGYVEIRDVFNLSKYGKVAGCYVTEGAVRRGSSIRVIRDSVVVHTGKLKALKRFKEDVKEVTHGFECGLSFENYEEIKVGDRVEVFEVTEQARTL